MVSYVVSFSLSAGYEGIRRLYPHGTVNLLITRFTVRQGESTVIPVSVPERFRPDYRGFRVYSCSVIDRS